MSENIFSFFFLINKKSFFKKITFFKNFFLKKKTKKKQKKNKKKTKRYNFTRLWFIKYNNYILLNSFVFFYFKLKQKKPFKKKTIQPSKFLRIFWKKKKGYNFKRGLFMKHNYLHLFF